MNKGIKIFKNNVLHLQHWIERRGERKKERELHIRNTTFQQSNPDQCGYLTSEILGHTGVTIMATQYFIQD